MFKLVTSFKPSGDQPKAIEKIYDYINNKNQNEVVLLGATGTGKTFTIANIINKLNKKTLVLAPNKTLAGQLYHELKELFPENRVEFFISYYDYYQPEAYVSSTDTYIEKDASINDEIDELRHSATSSLLEREDTIIVASVSCIYGIGDKEEYINAMFTIRVGDMIKRNQFLQRLVDLQYERQNLDFKRGSFRVRGDVVEIILASESKNGLRIEFFGDEIDRIREFDVLTGAIKNDLKLVSIFPATHFVTNKEKIKESVRRIKLELEDRLKYFEENNKLLEHQRLKQRTEYDMEMLLETGVCSGVENYSRHLALKAEGETPTTLIDFFGDDYLLIIDESHVTVPQIGGMYNGDRSRKQNLVDYGFRLPSALDNRPLKFKEFEDRKNKVIYLSATPGNYELENKYPIVEQIIRPTGLLDPIIEVRPTKGQIDDIVSEINKRVERNERVLITTLTIKMSEDLTSYLQSLNIKVAYLHSEVKSLERIQILRDLRLGKYDCLVGINLLREGLDLPEVSLVCILDSDKQGFLRSDRSLIQTIGRAARNQNGLVIMYADTISQSMEYAINETKRRRQIQEEYNKENNIVPKTIIKKIYDAISLKDESKENIEEKDNDIKNIKSKNMTKFEKEELIKKLETQMKQAAKNLDFEEAMQLRDLIFEIRAGIK